MTANICLQLEDDCSPIWGTISDTYSNTLLHQEAELKPCCYDNFSSPRNSRDGTAKSWKIVEPQNKKSLISPLSATDLSLQLQQSFSRSRTNFFSFENYIPLTNRPFSLTDFIFLINTDHVTIPRRVFSFEVGHFVLAPKRSNLHGIVTWSVLENQNRQA